MELKFSKKDIKFIVKMHDVNHWSFAQIADDLGCPYYVDEIAEAYERNSTIAIKDSKIDKFDFIKEAYKGMLAGAASRRGDSFKWGELTEDELKKHHKAIGKLYKRSDFWLCWDLYKDNDYKSMYKPTLDHIIPVSKGGTDQLDNLQWLPRFANVWKLAESNEDWRQLVRQAPQFFIELDKLYSRKKMPNIE